MNAWDDLLAEFRALGGTADNIRFGQGQFGRGIFPIDPAKPIAMRVPDNLLVAAADMVFESGVPRVGNAAVGERERAWLNRYQEEFAWGGGGGDEIIRKFEAVGALPAELRQSLLTKYACGPWFLEPTEQVIQQRYFGTRTITYRGRSVVMPLIELVNHGDGVRYDLSDGVALRGNFLGEVLVQYADVDSFDYFISFCFATQRPVAFSLPLGGNLQSERLEIGNGFNTRVTSERSWIPAATRKANVVSLPFLLLGNIKFPRLPKGIFYRLMRAQGCRGFEEAFDLVHHLNCLHFIGLLEELEGFEQPIARTLRAMARYQLRALSFCYGIREV
jgi:hypothetical protein